MNNIQIIANHKNILSRKSGLPKKNGSYLTRDGNILVRQGDIFTLERKESNKGYVKRLQSRDVTELISLLKQPGYVVTYEKHKHLFTNYKNADADIKLSIAMSILETAMHLPVRFHSSWLFTSQCPFAKEMRKTVKDAKLIKKD
jgi:hypothetical protein